MALIGKIIYKWLFSIAMLVYQRVSYPIASVYGIYANIWGILMVNVIIYSIHGSYGYLHSNYISVYAALIGFPHLHPSQLSKHNCCVTGCRVVAIAESLFFFTRN